MIKNSAMRNPLKNPYLQFVIFGVILALLPTLAKAGILKSSHITLLGSVLIYAVAALGLNLLLGYSGLVSLGTAGFMGLGAYLSAYLSGTLGLPFAVALIIAVLVPTIIGAVIGIISMRVEGLYLAIVTLCVAEIMKKTFEELVDYTGGFAGIKAAYPSFFGLQLNRDTTFIFLVVMLVLVMILMYNLVNGQTGRAFHAIRGSTVAAQAMGINLLKYRLLSFVLATALAALSGALYVHFIKYSFPTVWSLPMSLNILAIIVIGGMRSIYGTVLGAFVVYAFPDLVLKPLFGDISAVPYIFNGVLIVLVILFYPQGFINVFKDIKNLFLRLKGGVTKND